VEYPLRCSYLASLHRYTIRELQSDIEKQLSAVADVAERERLRGETKLGIFVVHNK